MTEIITAIGLVLVIEGALYALMPGRMRQMMMQLLAMPENSMRTAGVTCAIIGFVIVILMRGL